MVREPDVACTCAHGQRVARWVARGRERGHVGGVRGPLATDRDHCDHQDGTGEGPENEECGKHEDGRRARVAGALSARRVLVVRFAAVPQAGAPVQV